MGQMAWKWWEWVCSFVWVQSHASVLSFREVWRLFSFRKKISRKNQNSEKCWKWESDSRKSPHFRRLLPSKHDQNALKTHHYHRWYISRPAWSLDFARKRRRGPTLEAARRPDILPPNPVKSESENHHIKFHRFLQFQGPREDLYQCQEFVQFVGYCHVRVSALMIGSILWKREMWNLFFLSQLQCLL